MNAIKISWAGEEARVLLRPGVPAVLLLFLVLLMSSCSAGTDSPRDCAEDYVTALNARDGEELSDLVPESYDAHAAIRRLISTDGGHHIDITHINTNDEFGNIADIDISGSSTVGRYHERLTALREDGRWFLALGEPRSGPFPGKTASTRRPSS